MACGSFGASLLALVGFSANLRFHWPCPPPLVWGCPSFALCPVARCPQQGPGPARPMDASLLPMLPAFCTRWEAPTAGLQGTHRPSLGSSPLSSPATGLWASMSSPGQRKRIWRLAPRPQLGLDLRASGCRLRQFTEQQAAQIPKPRSHGAAKPRLSLPILCK